MSFNSNGFTPADQKGLATCITNPQLFIAALEYLKLKKRTLDPDGEFDKAKRFSLSNPHACCAGIRSPSRAFPYPEMHHGRTAVHVAHVHGIPELETLVRRYARLMIKHPILQSSGQTAASILAAAAAEQALASIYVGQSRRTKNSSKSAPTRSHLNSRNTAATRG